MPRIFSFEREVYTTLELIPLSVRRKLDLAGVKLSLRGWQAMPETDRRALVAADEGFASALEVAAERAGVALRPIPVEPPRWRSPAVPTALRAALDALGRPLGDAAWAGLDDEARYVLCHLAGRDSEEQRARLRVALTELGV